MAALITRCLNLVESIDPEQVPETVFEFLLSLSGPTVIKIKGQRDGHDAGCRIITTLLHANEPSGFRVLHKFLKEGFEPLFDTYFILASIRAAKQEPVFSHRFLPGERDLNRCFSPPYTDTNGQLAKAIIDFIVEHKPECVIDLHNTSGSGPIFSVSTRHQCQHIGLGSFFSRWLVHAEIPLGAIMELPLTCPIITVEAGGAQDKDADFNAYIGLRRLLLSEEPFDMQQPVDVLHRPIRLEVNTESSLAYSDRPVFGVNITLCQDIERFNFGLTPIGERVGWADIDGLKHFNLNGQQLGVNVVDYFNIDSGELRTTQPLKIFMATSCLDIAKSDCILYFVAADTHVHHPTQRDQVDDDNSLPMVTTND